MHQCPIPLAINHYKLSSLSNISLTLHSIAGQKSGIGLTRLKAEFGKAAFLSVSREESLSLLIQVVGWTQVLWVSDWGSHFLAAVSWGLFPTSKGQRFFASWLPSFIVISSNGGSGLSHASSLLPILWLRFSDSFAFLFYF